MEFFFGALHRVCSKAAHRPRTSWSRRPT
jgi:hypothetical protein